MLVSVCSRSAPFVPAKQSASRVQYTVLYSGRFIGSAEQFASEREPTVRPSLQVHVIGSNIALDISRVSLRAAVIDAEV